MDQTRKLPRTPSLKELSLKDQCLVPTKAFHQRLTLHFSVSRRYANTRKAAPSHPCGGKLVDNASTRSTGEQPCCNRELVLSLPFSYSLPLFLFRFRNYSGVIAFRPHVPVGPGLHEFARKKKERTVRFIHV